MFTVNFINIIYIKKVSDSENSTNDIFVSVLIPARNEGNNIKECVSSVLNQIYKNFELIVLDDNSDDKTFEILNSFDDDRIKVLKGKILPSGWVGKNFACHQLQENAAGQYILFIDADTVMNKNCLGCTVNFIDKHKTDLMSIMPYEESITFWEKLTIPMLYFAVMLFLPLPLVENSRRKDFSAGNGQFMFFRKSFYDEIGGHESIKNNIVDDIFLSKRVKEFGGKLIFADGTDIMKCRMYNNLEEIWAGFSKNFFAGLSFSVSGLIGIVLTYFALFVLPVFILVYGLLNGDEYLINISLISIILPVAMRISHSIKFRQPLLFSFINFISAAFTILLALNSFRKIKFGKGAIWKDRIYKEEEIRN